MAVRLSAYNSPVPTGRMSVKSDIGVFTKIRPDSPVCWKSDEIILPCMWKKCFVNMKICTEIIERK